MKTKKVNFLHKNYSFKLYPLSFFPLPGCISFGWYDLNMLVNTAADCEQRFAGRAWKQEEKRYRSIYVGG